MCQARCLMIYKATLCVQGEEPRLELLLSIEAHLQEAEVPVTLLPGGAALACLQGWLTPPWLEA